MMIVGRLQTAWTIYSHCVYANVQARHAVESALSAIRLRRKCARVRAMFDLRDQTLHTTGHDEIRPLIRTVGCVDGWADTVAIGAVSLGAGSDFVLGTDRFSTTSRSANRLSFERPCLYVETSYIIEQSPASDFTYLLVRRCPLYCVHNFTISSSPPGTCLDARRRTGAEDNSRRYAMGPYSLVEGLV